MKLATLKNNSRDGELVVVSKDLTKAVKVPEISLTMQSALDNWSVVSKKLELVYQEINSGKCSDSFSFDEQKAHSPLPRAYQWADASTYLNHVELVRKSRGVEMPKDFYESPLMYQGGSDSFIAPFDDIEVVDFAHGVDFEAEVCVITDDVPMAISAKDAASHIKLVMLTNDVSLRNLAPQELTKGFGFFNCKPASSFSPVAVTPDELGDSWQDSKIHLPLISHLNDKLFGKPNAGVGMQFSFAELIAHAAKTRKLGAGTIIGSGTVSNPDRSVGSSCIVEQRTIEILDGGAAKTEYMKDGDLIHIEMLDKNGQTIFGSIKQRAVKYKT